MSSVLKKTLIEDGDTAIFWESPNSMRAVVMKKNTFFNNRSGNWDHNEIIGKPYGSRVRLPRICAARAGAPVGKRPGWSARLF